MYTYAGRYPFHSQAVPKAAESHLSRTVNMSRLSLVLLKLRLNIYWAVDKIWMHLAKTNRRWQKKSPLANAATKMAAAIVFGWAAPVRT